MPSAVDNLVPKVQALETVGDSVVALVSGLSAQIRATAGDAAAANKLADEVDAKSAVWAQAVIDNTPAETP